MAKKQEYGPGKEFFSEWHHDAYIEGLKRELQGATNRGEDDYAENVRDELRRLHVLPAKVPAKK